MCVVRIEYSADNLRYKLRFVNGQMHVHFTNFCLYESFGPESLFRILSCKRDYGNRVDFPCENFDLKIISSMNFASKFNIFFFIVERYIH